MPRVTPFLSRAEVSSQTTPEKCLVAHPLFGKTKHMNVLQINEVQ